MKVTKIAILASNQRKEKMISLLETSIIQTKLHVTCIEKCVQTENKVEIAHTMHMITPGGMRDPKPSHSPNHNHNPKL